MGKKIVILLVIGLCALSFLYAGKSIAAMNTNTNTALDQTILAARRAEMEQTVRQVLTSKEWVVNLALANMPGNKAQKGQGAAVGTDVLTFNDRALKSQNLAAKGYPASNYNLSVADDGTATLETMPTNKDGDQVYIRVELKNGAIAGVMSMRSKKGGKVVYSFSSVGTPSQPAPVVHAKTITPETESDSSDTYNSSSTYR